MDFTHDISALVAGSLLGYANRGALKDIGRQEEEGTEFFLYSLMLLLALLQQWSLQGAADGEDHGLFPHSQNGHTFRISLITLRLPTEAGQWTSS